MLAIAAARSVLTVGRVKGKPYTRAIVQGKNNLAPEGQAIGFELDPATGFQWIGVMPITIDELLSKLKLLNCKKAMPSYGNSIQNS